MVTEYENNLIQPPVEFREKPVQAPRTVKPIPAPRTKITKLNAVKSYEVGIKNKKDPLIQLNNTNKWIETYLKNILNEMKGIKLVETLKITLKKTNGQDTLYKTTHKNSKTLTTTNNIEIGELLKLASEQITKKIAQWLSEGSGWIIESVDKHYLNIVKYKPMKGNSYISLPKE